MADNVAVTPGSGPPIATDDVGGVQYQRVKIAHGADGTATDVSSASALPVDPVASLTIKFARVNATADGSNDVVAAVTSKKIRVLGYAVQSTGAGTVTWKSSTTSTLAEMVIAANGDGVSYSGGVQAPAFETVSGEKLTIDNPAGVDTKGHLSYIEV